ncbi:MAG: hypothetical protein JXO51_06135 [Candidatus Aminicenantes bacterium]|nr:hypothetical protein [Candidatus Aminicenantes bacterium]
MPVLRFFLAAVILLPGSNFAAAQQAEPVLKENVVVVNVEVPVRVFCADMALAGLQKEDFRLFEDDVPQEINGFLRRRKKMSVQRVTLVAEPGISPPPRYFVLCFRITEYNDPLRKGMDYFFRHILRDQDQLLVFVNERTLLLKHGFGQERRRDILERVLHDESAHARRELDAFFQRVQQDVDQNRLRALIENSRMSFTVPQIIGFLQAYLNAWQEFRKKYLVPDLDKFYNFAHHLRKINGEKWVLSFFQLEMFPKIKIGSSVRRSINELVESMNNEGGAAGHFARVISRALDAIDRSLNAAGEFPAEQIGKMLIGVDTTYHCFLSGVVREGISEDLEYRKVASDLEKSLREITEKSGGEVVFSADIGSALHEIEEKEDVYYVLTYEPKSRERVGKVRIEVDRPRCRLLYDDRVRSDYIAAYLKEKKAEDPTLQLDGISLSGSRLQMAISSFKMVKSEDGRSGRLHVSLSVRDARDRTLYERSRALVAHEATVSLAVDFAFLPPGRYDFLVQVRDELTGRTALDILQADVR